MESALRDDAMIYNAPRRLYAYYISRKFLTFQSIRYCPFCGSRLPEDLVEEYDVAVFEAMGQNGTKLITGKKSFISSSKYLPPEFQTDEWWKKRGV
jgi:hypothetical protein